MASCKCSPTSAREFGNVAISPRICSIISVQPGQRDLAAARARPGRRLRLNTLEMSHQKMTMVTFYQGAAEEYVAHDVGNAIHR